MLVSALRGACVGAALGASLFSPPAYAIESGGQVLFEARCAACHEGGGNVLNPSKNLRLDTLKANGYDTLPPTVELLRNGKGQMPKYQGAIPKISRLTDEELELVATYTLQKAADGW